MQAPTILFYTNNIELNFIIAEFTAKFDTGLGWVHTVSGSLNLMPDDISVKTRWPLVKREGRFSNCPDGTASAPVADLWVKTQFVSFLASRSGLASRILKPEALARLQEEVAAPGARASAMESLTGWTAR